MARQGLLERSADPIPRLLERMAGLQAQYAPSMYIGLWSRLTDFARDDLTRALEARSVIQATLMRSTIHLVSREDFWPLAIATRDARKAQWLVATKGEEAPIAAAAETLRAALRGGRTMRRKDIEALIGKEETRAVGPWLDIVRAPPSGTWERRRADLYALAEDWIGPPPAMSQDDAVDHLVTRYLAGFGPATAKDVASFTGLAPAVLKPVLARLDLVREGDLLDVPGAPRPDPDTPAPPRFLCTWDASLLVHARRTGFLPEEHRPRIFGTKTPQSFPSFTLDGVIAGTWKHDKGRIELSPFGRLGNADRKALDAEAERLAAFHA